MIKKNLLITCKLEENALQRHLGPISKSKNIKKITVIRDNISKKNKKIEYIKTRYNNKILKNIKKILLIKKYAKNSDIIWGFYLIPHGINALIGAKLNGKKSGISLIGTDLNIHLKSFYKKPLFYILNKFDIITVTGTNSRRYLIENGIDKKKIFILPNAVNVHKFKKRKVSKKFDFIYVGRLVKIKNVDKIISLVSRLNDNNRKYSLLIIGEGPEEDNLKEYVKECDMQNNVKFLGYVNNVEKYLNQSKFFIMASESEGMPLSLLEAMSSGVVPIVPKVGDIKDVANYKTSVLYDKIDHFLIKKIICLTKNKKIYLRMQKNAVKKIKMYSDDNVTKFWEKIIKRTT